MPNTHGQISMVAFAFITRNPRFLLVCYVSIPGQISVTFSCLCGGDHGVRVGECAQFCYLKNKNV